MKPVATLALLLLALVPAPFARAQEAADPHAGHHGHAAPAVPAPAPTGADGAASTAPGTAPGAAAAATAAPAGASDAPDAAQAQGLQSEPSPHDPVTGRHESHGSDGFLWLRADQLEGFAAGDDSGLRWKGSASWGDTLDRVGLASEGDRAQDAAPELDTRLYWSHAVSPFWNAVLALRETNAEGEARSWAGIGLQGLAPFRIETGVALYAGAGGQAELRVDLQHELLLTNRLILQPQLELNAFGRDDAMRGEGAGLAETRAGLRLRYELSRQFAPYLGVEWTQACGATRDLRDAVGERAHEARTVAGLRFWY